LHDQAAQVGNEVAERMIIEGFKNERYSGRAPKSLSKIEQVIESSTRDPIELAKEVVKLKRLHYNDHFYRTTLKDELNKEGAKGSTATRPWTFDPSEPNGKQGKDPKHTILQVAIRGFSRKRATLNNVK
jgi:hypothetical protein